ncbi:hypothetical protein BT69DRAFT_1210430, partial [Atractiella rhizophila]
DVEGSDRQDDRSAARIFSAPLLEHLVETRSEELGLIVYNFVHGELLDAWENRRLQLIERVEMALRAKFFLAGWKQFVESHPFYTTSRQFISREAYDIFNIEADGLVTLIFVYRQYFPDYPLLPWRLTTETNEHAFAGMCTCIKSFPVVDALLMVPKLRVLLASAFQNLSTVDQATTIAAGYDHTYATSKDIDLVALAQSPTNLELEMCAEAAYHGAQSLLRALGMIISPEHAELAHSAVADYLCGVDMDIDCQEEIGYGEEEKPSSGYNDAQLQLKEVLLRAEDYLSAREGTILDKDQAENVLSLSFGAVSSLIAQENLM